MPHYTMLYYAILCYTILYYTILYYTNYISSPKFLSRPEAGTTHGFRSRGPELAMQQRFSALSSVGTGLAGT